MTYLMLICVPDDVRLTPEQRAAIGPATDSWVAEIEGVRAEGRPLGPARETAVVRRRDGEVMVSDGPFAETKEQVAGLDILTCPTLAEAAEIAAQHPTALIGALELRPLAQE